MKKTKELLEDVKPVLEFAGPPVFGLILLAAVIVMLILTGCAANVKRITDSATNKNLNADGYLMWGAIDTNNPETGTPEGKMIIGRLTYKSRKVGIPADQKVPTTGYFKSTQTKSLFGTEEKIVEFDFTAGSDAEAEKALKLIEEKLNKQKAAENESKTVSK